MAHVLKRDTGQIGVETKQAKKRQVFSNKKLHSWTKRITWEPDHTY